MRPKVKIRGIYSTALTKLFLDAGYTVVEPSYEIQTRFGIGDEKVPHEIIVWDRENLQGVFLRGETEKVQTAVSMMQEQLFDSVLRERIFQQDAGDLVQAAVEFPSVSKGYLDYLRSTVAPTVTLHHRFRLICPPSLERAEKHTQSHPGQRKQIEEALFLDSVIVPLRKTEVVRLEQEKILGKAIPPRVGLLHQAEGKRITIKRTFREGRYDGLDLPIEPGDHGLTEIVEGAWYVKHTYYARSGVLKGIYVSINTPVELYPFGARCVDLDVDVVCRAGESPFIVDKEKLLALMRQGMIGSGLGKRAVKVAEGLVQEIQAYSLPQTL